MHFYMIELQTVLRGIEVHVVKEVQMRSDIPAGTVIQHVKKSYVNKKRIYIGSSDY